jgi:NAD-dependent deacetylase
MISPHEEIARLLVERGDCVALTGAGISAASGIPTFRSKGGLWEKYDPMVYASADMFRQDPSKYWLIRGEFIRNYGTYRPNPAHYALVELEELGILRHVITQNIDGLHKSAGNRHVTEIHGSLREIYCLECNKEYLAPHVPDGEPPNCDCGGVLKPNTVLFGEQLPPHALERAYHESSTCRTMLVIGTSAVVQPAASLPFMAKHNGALVIEINPEISFADADMHIQEKAGTALPRIIQEIQTIRR